MKFFLVLLFLFVFILAIVGFRNLQTSGEPNVSDSSVDLLSVTINSATFTVRQAITPEEQRVGLGGVEYMPLDEGMIFSYDKPTYSSFWMRGMRFPLDIIFILDNKVVGVFENLPPADDADTNPPTWGGNLLADRVLEINAGQARRYGITVGDTVDVR